MERYFFQLNECGKSLADSEGCECASLEAARTRALAAAREVMCAELSEGRLCLSCDISVSDEIGHVVYVLPFRDAVRITGL